MANEPEIVVVGSQAVLGQFPNAPDALLASIEADVFPRLGFGCVVPFESLLEFGHVDRVEDLMKERLARHIAWASANGTWLVSAGGMVGA